MTNQIKRITPETAKSMALAILNELNEGFQKWDQSAEDCTNVMNEVMRRLMIQDAMKHDEIYLKLQEPRFAALAKNAVMFELFVQLCMEETKESTPDAMPYIELGVKMISNKLNDKDLDVLINIVRTS